MIAREFEARVGAGQPGGQGAGDEDLFDVVTIALLRTRSKAAAPEALVVA